jgi:drug/metabolite transporter (DMT)-like permease
MSIKKFFSIGPVLIVSAAILWALDGILRRSLFSLPPVTIVFYEHLIAAAIIAPFVYKTFKKEVMTQQVWGLIGIISLLSGLLGTLFFTTALVKVSFISFSVVFLLQKLQPLFAITSAHFLLKEKITKQYLPWAVLALVSAYFVTFPSGVVNFATGDGTMIAALFALGAAAAWGTSTTFSKMLLNKISDTQAAGWRFIVTSLFAGVAVFVLGAQSSLSVVGVPEVSRLVMIALSTGMVALWLYYRGLQKTEAKITTLLELTFPLLAVVIDAVIYKTFLQPTQIIAAIILMAAMFQIGRIGISETADAKT